MPFNTIEKELKRHLICRSLELWWWWKEREEVGEKRDEDLELFEAARERQKDKGRSLIARPPSFILMLFGFSLSSMSSSSCSLRVRTKISQASILSFLPCGSVHQRGKISMVPTTVLTFHVEKNCSTRNVGCFPQRTVPFTRRLFFSVWFKPINNWASPLYGWLCIQEHALKTAWKSL